MEIMKLIPTGKDYLWGGTRLREEYGKKIDLTPLAETWECSVHPDGPSYVINGTYKGKTLAEVLKEHPEYIGTKVENGELPVLVKFIDAKKDLSVQVHPDDAYAREHEGDNGKTEMWYVIDADEGAHLIYGFQHEVTEEILRKAVETGTLGKHLQKVPVHKGDTYFVPAGTVHGIGKGIVEAANKIIPQYISSHWLLVWIWERIYYLLGARLLCYMGGMYIAQKNIISVVKRRLDGIKHSNLMILGILLMLALVLVVLDKGILIVFYTFPVFVGFNCLKKNAKFSKVMLMLGKYSTYVWLIHPFIYRNAFPQITQIWIKLRFPILLLGELMVMSVLVSWPLNKISLELIQKLKI